jgi:hypothetical protein
MPRSNTKQIGALTVTRYKEHHACTNKCNGSDGRSFGRDHIQIAGWPLGWFCPVCVKDLTSAWQSARCNWETDLPDVEFAGRFSDRIAA